ncbi:cupin domain-containing protein [Phenylobacterium sp.]|jgi:anti-sigma factor ChrR (cupin superfamily)|uniref:cupin domain-containing protein n=1 Tax=Phenylobacterium sp. TaxID=1871053 RepID=UPI002F425E48
MSPKAARDAAWIEPTPAELALASLDMALPPLAPPPGLWARIKAELAVGRPQGAAAMAVDRYEGGVWRTLSPGVRMKRLWGKRTLLFECEPGAVVPAHRHRTFEHSLVLSGDVTSDEGDFQSGDYMGMPGGSMHGAWTTRTGCLVLIQYEA